MGLILMFNKKALSQHSSGEMEENQRSAVSQSVSQSVTQSVRIDDSAADILLRFKRPLQNISAIHLWPCGEMNVIFFSEYFDFLSHLPFYQFSTLNHHHQVESQLGLHQD
jgi:hypothetical protein